MVWLGNGLIGENVIVRNFLRLAFSWLLFGSVAALPGLSVQAGELNLTEQRIVAAVDAHEGRALALLEQVVNINSGSMNFAGVRAVGDVFRAEFDALGFSTSWLDGASFNRAGHLVAERLAEAAHADLWSFTAHLAKNTSVRM